MVHYHYMGLHDRLQLDFQCLPLMKDCGLLVIVMVMVVIHSGI